MLAVALWALVIACVPVASQGPACSGDTINGTREITLVVDPSPSTTTATFEVVLGTSTVAALLPGASGFAVCPGTGTDGAFTIPMVPVGPYYLQLDSIYVVTSQRNPALRSDGLGHNDAMAVLADETQVNVSVNGADPWKTSDILQLYSAVTGTFIMNPQGKSTSPPAAGAVSFNFNFDWSQSGNRTNGDATYLTQLVSGSASAQPVTTLTKALLLNPVILDGSGDTLSGTLSAVSLDRNLSMDWKRTQFTALQSGVGQQAVNAGDELALSVIPDGATRGDFGSSAPLLYVDPPANTGDVPLSSVPYGTPYPGTWSTLVRAASFFGVEYQAAASTASNLFGSIGTVDVAPKSGQMGPLQPLSQPVGQPMLDGQDAFQPRDGVGETPLLSWTLPSPPPDSIHVLVRRLTRATDGTTTSKIDAAIYLNATDGQGSVRIPPGVLKAGEHYFFAIRTFVSPNVQASEDPFLLALPYGFADLLTATVSP